MPGNVTTVVEVEGKPVASPPVDAPDIDDNTIARILSGRRRIVRVPWPSVPTVSVGLRVLGRLEMSESLAQAHLDAEMLGNGKELPGVVNRCFRDLVVHKAVVRWPPPTSRDEDPELLFSSVEDLRLKVIETDVEQLWDQYAALEKTMAPLQRAEFTGNEPLFQELIDRLGKEPGSPILKLLPRESLETLVVVLVSRMGEPSPQTSSSSGSSS